MPITRSQVQNALARSRPHLVTAREGDRQASVALILQKLEEDEDPRLLFVRRAEVEGDPWSGHMAFPGGHVEADDTDSIDAARRETREEVGLDLLREAVIGRLDDAHPSTRRLPSVIVTPWVAWLEGPATIRTNHEIQYHRWVPLAVLTDPAFQSELRLDHDALERVFPTIEFEGDTIWGLTHRILENFLDRLE